jgi:signal transduction histidine kinase
MSQSTQFQIRPYARLLTMLGDQLIKNEQIALIELIKNSYDADAEWVKVSFLNFGDNYEIKSNSMIVIEDNGIGMTQDIIENHWLNPATPEKKKRKAEKNQTANGRVIQGEKGIGRFAILKLGRKIDIITRTRNDELEHFISYDFSRYDDEFLTENGERKDLFLDDLRVIVKNRNPERIAESRFLLGTRKIKRSVQGTIIEISNLKGSWSEKKVESLYLDLTKLESIFSQEKSGFQVYLYKDNEQQKYKEDQREKLENLLIDRAVIKIEEGFFDAEKLEYRFKLNGDNKTIMLLDTTIMGLKSFRERFGKTGEIIQNRKIECGSFTFGFYIFDFGSKVPAKYKLDKSDKDIIKSHRIYLYRDNIRVYPYGEPEDDWLQIDMYRGTIAVGHFLSNDQVVGHVNITQKNNPHLQDKTNREGLIFEGNATEDFITIIQSFLYYIRHKPYARYLANNKNKEDQDVFNKKQVQNDFDELEDVIVDNPKAQNVLSKIRKNYGKEREYLIRRVEITEDLASVGLSVETASHDIMGIMNKVLANLDGLIKDLLIGSDIDKEELMKELQSIRGGLGFMESQIKDIQLLFKSSKQRRKLVRVKEVIEKVEQIYRRVLQKESIDFSINTVGSPLVAKTTDAVLLQLFLNLFDNAVYWLQQTAKKDKKIEIFLDGNECRMIFSDNGPGIDKEDVPYIFEPFYSGKGEAGRGLGLYIARQLLERNDYSIELAELKSDKILSGANFIVNFFIEGNE